ncbi:hypothetical protein [Streptomyces synnematoformans]|uniref:Nucleic acid-binding protein n=1 Tax=Streptomyces synnematoformans TaxID=415721 RepID=A0ABN2XMP6_9ACTN
MTSTVGTPEASDAQVLVWDTSPLHHAIKAEKIDILGDMARNAGEGRRRNLTTQAVIDELLYHQLPLDGLGWLEIVHVDGLEEIHALVRWMERVSGQRSNQGEATVLAYAETHDAIAVIDDRDARRIGRTGGLEVYGSLRIVAESVRVGHTTEYAATALVDALISTGMRYPCPPGEFITWAKRKGIL